MMTTATSPARSASVLLSWRGATMTTGWTIEQLVRDAYSARSEYAHGGKRDKIAKVDLAKLRRVVRRCILTRLILGDPTPAGPLHVAR